MTALFAGNMKRENPNALPARLAARLLAIILAATLVMGLLMCGIDRAFAGPLAHSEIVVQSDQIRLGDVFDGVTKHADFVLAPAPAPGQEMFWNNATLLRIATAFNLSWQPNGAETLRIKRAGTVVDSDTIRAVIRDHLATEDADAMYEVRFQGDLPQILIAGDETPVVTLVDFDLSPRGGTFSAIIRAGTPGTEGQTVNLRGIAERMVRVPVLKSPLKNGQIIGQRDIEFVTHKAADMRPGAVLNVEDMIGATPRRSVNASQVVRVDDLEMPRLVSRGDLVTMIFSNGGMMLTARGKALEDGAMNDVIKVSNTGSKRMIEARVTNTKEVTVTH